MNVPDNDGEELNNFPHIPLADIKPGDLIFRNASLVGIYIGNNDVVAARESVSVVSMSARYYAGAAYGAERP